MLQQMHKILKIVTLPPLLNQPQSTATKSCNRRPPTISPSLKDLSVLLLL